MSLPLTHAGLSAPGISAALDLKFASTLSLTSSSGITPSFSRASSGSYFDSAGVLRYANVNLITYSEQFNDASWSKSAASISANSIIAPDGKTTADTLTENSANATHFVNKASSTSAGTIYTSSIYAKAGTRKYIDVTSVAQDGGTYRRFNNVFDLETGTWQSTASLNSPSNTAYSITSVGNGWYRISSSILAYGSTHYLVVYLSDSASPTRDASNDVIYTGNGTGNFYIWGAQLEASSTVGTYVPTTTAANSAPRFDHTFNGTSWVSRGLLVEEQRTSILNFSEDFGNAYWGKSGASVTTNSTISPDGNTTADKFVENAAGGAHVVGRNIGTTSGTQTWSFFAKKSERTWIAVNAYVGADARTWFNLDSGTVGTNAAGSTASIQNVGNGWFRCSVSRTGGAGTYFDIHIANADNSYSYTGDGTSGLFVWGAQLETGSFPTSYIPTTSSSSTRSADVCQITGGDFSSFWNASEGSVAVEFDTSKPTGIGVPAFAQDAGTTTGIGTYFQDLVPYWFVNISGSNQCNISTSAITSGILSKLSATYKVNDFAVSLNGAAVLTDTSGNVPTGLTTLAIGNQIGTTQYINGHIARLRYFNKRLTDKQLEDLCKPEEQLKLDLKFSENLSLTPVVGPTPSFSRASTGTYFNASGVLTSAAINAPRFDHTYDGTNWISRGLLVEEQRTNSLTYSEDFTNAIYVKSSCTVSSNAASAPDGATTADLVYPTASSSSFYFNSYTGTSQYSASVFAKASGKSCFYFYAHDGLSLGASFNLSNGTVSNVIAGSSAAITNVGNGWFRCTITSPSPASYLLWQVGFQDAQGSGTTVTPNGTDGILFWGAQRELGSFPTSYIPTTSSSVVRSADVCQITGTNFSGIWNQGEGSSVVEYDCPNIGTRVQYQANSAGSTNINSVVSVGSTQYFEVYIPPHSALINGGTLSNGVPAKVSAAYRVNDFAVSMDGNAVVTDTSGTVPAPNKLIVGSDSSTYINGHIARLRYYSIRLPNRLLIAKSQ